MTFSCECGIPVPFRELTRALRVSWEQPKAGLAATQSTSPSEGEGSDLTEPVTSSQRRFTMKARRPRASAQPGPWAHTLPGGPAGEAPGPLLMAGLPTPSQQQLVRQLRGAVPAPHGPGVSGLSPRGCVRGRGGLSALPLPVPLRGLPGRSPQKGRRRSPQRWARATTGSPCRRTGPKVARPPPRVVTASSPVGRWAAALSPASHLRAPSGRH